MPSSLTSETQIQIIMSFGLNKASAEQVVFALDKVSSSAKEMKQAAEGATGNSALAGQMVSALKEASNLQSAMARDARAEAQARREAIKQIEDELKYEKMLTDEFAKHNELSDRQKQQLGIGGARGGGGMFSGRGMGPGFAEFMIAMSMRSVPGMMGSPIAEGMMGASSINSAISMFQGMTKEMGGAGAAAAMVLKSLGPVTLGFTALTVIMTQLGQVIDAGTAAVKLGVDQLKTYYETIETGTTASIQKTIAGLAVQQGAAASTAKDVMAQIMSAAGERIADINAGNQRWGNKPLDLTNKDDQLKLLTQINIAQVPAVKALFDQYNALTEESDKLTAQMDGLKSALKSTDVAANDAAAGIVAAGDRKNKVEQQIAADYAMTGETATKRVGTLLQDESAQQNNIVAYQNAIATVQAGTPQYLDYQEKLKAAQQALADDKNEVKLLTEVIIPLIKEREAEAEAAKAQQKALEELDKDYTKILDDMAKARADVTKLEEDWADTQAKNAKDAIRQANRDKITGEWQDKIDAAKVAEKLGDAEAKLADDRRKGEQAIADDVGKFMRDEAVAVAEQIKKLTRMNEDYLIQRRRTEQDMNDEMAQDAADRDVLAWIRAREAGEKKLIQESEDQRLEFTRSVEDFRDKMSLEQQQHQQELAQRRAELAQKLADDQNAMIVREKQSDLLQKQFDGIKLAWQRQDQATREAEAYASYQRQLASFRQHLADMEAAASQMGGNYAYAGGLNNSTSNNSWNYPVTNNNGNTFNINAAAGVTVSTLESALTGLAQSFANAFGGVH